VHDIEPYYNWRGYYVASEDPYSPFFEREYSEFEFSSKIYNYYIHPQWDSFGSQTLFMKVLYCHYDHGFAVIEFIGEWNDLLYNDIMFLKREVIYYEEWFEDVNDREGWIALMNIREHVQEDISSANIDSYFVLGGKLNEVKWRTMNPDQLFESVERHVMRRLTT